MSNLRLGTLDLELEKGRYTGTPREERFCKICKTHEVEDESHFIFRCPTLEPTRKPYIDKISNFDFTFKNLDTNSRLLYLYYNSNISDTTQVVAAEMLVELKRAKCSVSLPKT